MQPYDIEYELRTLRNLDRVYVPEKSSAREEIRRIEEVHCSMQKEIDYLRKQANRHMRARIWLHNLSARRLKGKNWRLYRITREVLS